MYRRCTYVSLTSKREVTVLYLETFVVIRACLSVVGRQHGAERGGLEHKRRAVTDAHVVRTQLQNKCGAWGG